jgi:hypothetical protein
LSGKADPIPERIGASGVSPRGLRNLQLKTLKREGLGADWW